MAGESKETQKKFSKDEFYSTGYYVIAGKSPDWADEKEIRLKYYHESGVDAVWWKHDPADYEYGDIFIANGIEPEKREVPYYNGTVRDYFFGSDAKLEKLGNCKTLMTLKKLKIESADYDGYGHWSVHLQDPSEKKDYGYYYGYRNDAYFGVDLSDSDNGTFCTFAFVGDIPIVAVEKGK